MSEENNNPQNNSDASAETPAPVPPAPVPPAPVPPAPVPSTPEAAQVAHPYHPHPYHLHQCHLHQCHRLLKCHNSLSSRHSKHFNLRAPSKVLIRRIEVEGISRLNRVKTLMCSQGKEFHHSQALLCSSPINHIMANLVCRLIHQQHPRIIKLWLWCAVFSPLLLRLYRR